MTILHALRGLEATSGISTFVVELCRFQIEAGHRVYFVYQRALELEHAQGVIVLREPDLQKLDVKFDIVHIHGIWAPFSVRMLKWSVCNKIPFVLSPHGCLMSRVLRKGRIKKWLFLNLFLRRLLNCASCWHCTGPGEVDACRSAGFKGPFRVIPLGCNIVNVDSPKRDVVLFLGRISEEKGLRFLIDAWNNISRNGWVLKIAGPDWFGERKVLERQISSAAILDIEFVGPADHALKARLYGEAKLFVLPSPVENFSLAVLDALAYGVPVICTRGTPWRCIEENNCGWWIDSWSSEAIRKTLQHAMSLSQEELTGMGRRARELATRRYSWDVVCDSVMNIYREIV